MQKPGSQARHPTSASTGRWVTRPWRWSMQPQARTTWVALHVSARMPSTAAGCAYTPRYCIQLFWNLTASSTHQKCGLLLVSVHLVLLAYHQVRFLLNQSYILISAHLKCIILLPWEVGLRFLQFRAPSFRVPYHSRNYGQLYHTFGRIISLLIKNYCVDIATS